MALQKHTMGQCDLLKSMPDQDCNKVDVIRGYRDDGVVALELILAGLITRPELKGMIGYPMARLINNTDTWIAQVIEESLIAMIKNLENDQRLAFVWGAPNPATWEELVLMMDGEDIKVDFELKVDFEAAVA